MLPAGSRAMDAGLLMVASSAEPPSPVAPIRPFPAMVERRPVDRVYLADAIVARVREEDVAAGIDGKAERQEDRRGCRGAAVPRKDPGAISPGNRVDRTRDEGGDGTGRRALQEHCGERYVVSIEQHHGAQALTRSNRMKAYKHSALLSGQQGCAGDARSTSGTGEIKARTSLGEDSDRTDGAAVWKGDRNRQRRSRQPQQG